MPLLRRWPHNAEIEGHDPMKSPQIDFSKRRMTFHRIQDHELKTGVLRLFIFIHKDCKIKQSRCRNGTKYESTRYDDDCL